MMIEKYKINQEQKKRIWKWLQSNNIANRGEFDGDKQKQLVGLIGEFEVHNYLLGYYPEFKKGFDGGVDIIYKDKTIDVKTMGRNVDCQMHYVNNFVASQLKYDCDVIIFVSVNKKDNTFSICGWIEKIICSVNQYFMRRERKDKEMMELFLNAKLICMRYLITI